MLNGPQSYNGEGEVGGIAVRPVFIVQRGACGGSPWRMVCGTLLGFNKGWGEPSIPIQAFAAGTGFDTFAGHRWKGRIPTEFES